MRQDEELCRHAFDSFLKEHGLHPDWADGREPPDYYVTVGHRRLAVEMTSIHGFTNLAGKDYPWDQLSKELLAFGEEVCRAVESSVEIRGCYLLSLPAVPKLKRWGKEIVQALAAFFKSDAPNAEKMPGKVILRPEGREVTVRKVKQDGSALIAQALPGGAFVTRREDQLAGLLAAAVRTKAHKLRAISEPSILVILDRYGFQKGLAEWRACLPGEVSNFEAVIRVQRSKAELVAGEVGPARVHRE